MNIKRIFKCTLGRLRCIKSGIICQGRVYIGSRVHIVNGRNITLGRDVQIRPDVDLFAGERIVIGDRCDIGPRNRFSGAIVMESDVLLGPDNFICSENHAYENINIPIKDQGAYSIRRNGHDELKIGQGSWIGTHAAIIGDVHIGKNCVIGANAVVTRDVPDYCVVAGIPARIIKRYNFNTKMWENEKCFKIGDIE